MSECGIKQKLEAAYQRRGRSVSVDDLRLLTGGSAAQTWGFQKREDSEKKRCILRIAHTGDQFELGLDKAAEAEVQNFAAQNGLKAAPIELLLQEKDALGEGFVMPFFDGEAIPQRILRNDTFEQARRRLAAQCGEELARLHALSTEGATLLPTLTVDKQLTVMKSYYQEIGQVIPIFDFGFRWLELNQPSHMKPVIVHGDFRNGNLLVDETGLSCVMDWELSHLGDPMEDLGWLCVPSWRFGRLDKPVGGFGTRDELFQAYEEAGGMKIELSRVRYWEILGVLKWGVICLYQSRIHISGIDRSINRAAIGRRVSEVELDLLAYFLKG